MWKRQQKDTKQSEHPWYISFLRPLPHPPHSPSMSSRFCQSLSHGSASRYLTVLSVAITREMTSERARLIRVRGWGWCEWEGEEDTGERGRKIQVQDGGDDGWTTVVDMGARWRWMQVCVPCRGERGNNEQLSRWTRIVYMMRQAAFFSDNNYQ